MEKATASCTFTAYNILKNKKGFTEEEAQIIATAMDTKESLVTKADVTEKFFHVQKMYLVFFVIIVVAVLLTNPKALDIISTFFGMARLERRKHLSRGPSGPLFALSHIESKSPLILLVV